MQKNKLPTVTLDRNKAALHLKSGKPDLKGTKTVFGQLFTELHGIQPNGKIFFNIITIATTTTCSQCANADI